MGCRGAYVVCERFAIILRGRVPLRNCQIGCSGGLAMVHRISIALMSGDILGGVGFLTRTVYDRLPLLMDESGVAVHRARPPAGAMHHIVRSQISPRSHRSKNRVFSSTTRLTSPARLFSQMPFSLLIVSVISETSVSMVEFISTESREHIHGI